MSFFARTGSIRLLLISALGTLLFHACAGSIYGEYLVPEENVVHAEGNHFSAVNATRYATWVYVNIEEGTATVVNEYGDEEFGKKPDEWHFAMHRFDCKTNGAEALETSFTNIDGLVASGSVPAGAFVADVWTDDAVAYDMSDMMNGNIIYAESYRNAELSKWMNVDISNMPPVYTPSNRVYVLRFGDGTMAALRFTGYLGPKSVRGYNSFEYLYPLEF